MAATITEILGQLQAMNPMFAELNRPEITVRKIEPLKPELTLPCDDVLYFGRTSALPGACPASIVCIADTHGLSTEGLRYANIVILPESTELTELCTTLITSLFSPDNALRSAESLLQSLAGAEGLKHMVEIGYQMLQNPFIISDKGWKALAMTDHVDIPDDTGWNEFKYAGALSFDTVSADIESKLTDRIEKSQKPFRWKGPNMRYPRLFCRVVIGARPVATISVIEFNRPFNERDSLLLPLLYNAVSAEMQKNKQQVTGGLLYEKFIEDLLDGKLKNPDVADEKSKALGWKRKELLYVLAVDIRGFDSEHFSVSYLRDYLEKMIPGSMAVVYNDTIVILASCGDERALGDAAMEPLAVFLQKYRIRCGLSRPFTDLIALREHYVQAVEALRLGTRLDSGRFLYAYEQYAILHIARICATNTGLSFFLHPKLLRLIEYDRAHHSAFSESLRAYLTNARNITNTAKALNLHRNSMIYHLKRIEEILGISLADSDMLFSLELSYRFLDYDQKLKQAGGEQKPR